MGKWKRSRSLPRRWQRNHLINQYGAICWICEKDVPMKQITIDHYVPLSKGGQDLLENYRLAHYDCNQLKADMLPDDFVKFQQGLITFDD